MRRTVVIEDRLLEDAKAALGTSTIKDTIEASLREVVRKRRLEEFARSIGTYDLDMTYDELVKLREEE